MSLRARQPSIEHQPAVLAPAGPGPATPRRLPPPSNRGVQRLLGSSSEGGPMPAELVARIAALRGSGLSLPGAQRSRLEDHYGFDLAPLRLHDDADSHALSRSLGANAFTSGHDIFLGPSAPRPETSAGERLLAHEVSHAVDSSTRAGGAPSGRLSAPGDAAERRAEGNARSFATGGRPGPRELAGLARPGAGGVERDGGAGAAGPVGTTAGPDPATSPVELSPPRYRVDIVGHASPRWRRPGASTAERQNLELSRLRALAVEDALRAAFRLRPVPVEFELVSRVEDADADHLSVDWRGSRQTITEAGGDVDADAEPLRRVEVGVDVVRTAHLTTGACEARQLPVSTNQWSVQVDAVLSAALGAAGSWGQGRLKNRLTGQVVKGGWVGGGGGGGLDVPIPAAAVGSGWKDFTTESNLTFESFDGTPVRYTELSAGLGIGYGAAFFSYSWFMEPVYVGGVAFNQWGIGGSVTAGPWQFSQAIPDPPVIGEEVTIPYTEEVGESFGATVTFPTGSSVLEAAGLDLLAEVIGSLP